MTVMKVSCQCARIAALSTLAVFFGLLANRSQAATSYFFDVNGSTAGFGVTTGSTYDWDDPTNGGFWSTSSAGTVATNGWVQGGFPRIQPAGTPTYTITVSNDEQIAGIFFDSAQSLTINAIGSGDLNIVSGLQGVLGLSTADVTINAPITGPGEIQPSNGGNIRLNGINTYSGGTNLSSTSTLIHFSNGSSFGSGPINMGVAGLVPLLGSGGSPIALPNDFTSSVNNAGINFAADANTPVISNGAWSLGAFNLVLRNNGNSTSPLTLTNTISGRRKHHPQCQQWRHDHLQRSEHLHRHDRHHRAGRSGRWFVDRPAPIGHSGHHRQQLRRRSGRRHLGPGWEQPDHEHHHSGPEHVDRPLGD